MANSPPGSKLLPEERELIRRWLTDFNRTWTPGRLADSLAALPLSEERVRKAALAEFVKLDLKRQWASGQSVELESYLEGYPDLGDRTTVAVGLVRAEYEARSKAGTASPLQEVAARFPRQAAQLEKAAQESPTPPASMTTQNPLDTSPRLPERFGRYQIVRVLGEGGMGTVYLARDEQLGRDVALKVPRLGPGTNSSSRQRFEREARAAAALRHPNICSIYDIGEVEGIPFLTMSFIRGRQLSEYVEQLGGIPASQAAVLVRKLALALQEAHTGGVIHRDLKPSNIMIDERKEPILMDFGLARVASAEESRLTRHGAVIGTPLYMSPEQVLGDLKAMGPGCDIYSLGVILYELLCGRTPYVGPPTLVLGLVIAQAPPAPTDFRPGLHATIVAICMKAMARKPEDRFASMGEFANALSDFIKGGDRGPAAGNVAASRVPTLSAASPPTLPSFPVRIPELQPLPDASFNVPVLPGRSPPAAIPELQLSPDPKPARASRELSWKVTAPVLGVVGLLAIAVLIWVVTQRSGDDERDPPGSGVEQASLSIGPIADVTLAPGENQQVEIFVTRKQCDGPVQLEFNGLPQNVLVLAKSVIPADSGSIRLTLFAERTAIAGQQSVAVTASLGGQTVTGRFSLAVREQTVQPVPTPASITVQANTARTLVAGKNITWEVQVKRQGFSGPVDVSLLGLPAGVQCKPVTVAADQDRATLDLSGGKQVKAGNHTVRLVASGGTTRGEANWLLTVQPAPELRLQPLSAVKLDPGKQVRVRFTVTRVSCDGAIAISVQGLPEQVALQQSVTLPAGATAGELVLVASASAAPGEAIADVTAQSGDLTSQAKLALTIGKAATVEAPIGLADPGSLTSYRGQDGKTFEFDVTGRVDGSVWGSYYYTDDSSLATAVVHAGVLKVGERGLVRVTIRPGRQSYQGTTKNGVTSADYGPFEGSYRVALVRRVTPAMNPMGGNSPGVLDDPGSLTGYRSQVGKTLLFKVTGSTTGSVYGTLYYTDDSTLATAAVHAGVLQNGETGVVKVTILGGYPSYRASTRNGVTSSPWAAWDGSFRVERSR